MSHLARHTRWTPVRRAAAAALALCAAAAADAQSLRCRGDFTQLGDSKASVLQKCGEPKLKDSFCKGGGAASTQAASGSVTIVQVVPCETVEEWTYSPGYGQFLTTLRFKSGKLVSVDYGDRVR